MEGGKAESTLECQSRHVPMKSKNTALMGMMKLDVLLVRV